ncbi:nickel/cobalt transporter regulator [Novosphingobium sp. PhB57]|uniref:RcnB family protein n=1 Tax=Novosphingobium sp. PhB57 TaxID=2485107 RepID=UPI0010E8BDA5|nr:RcnB family protein [Novosphingobium sp. PhB57]TCU62046.1 nickel/cobalt transporter regulator [Novosphingobium sp. PhB57]
MKFAYLAFVPLLLAPEGLLPLEFAAMAQQNRPGGSQGQGARPPSGGSNRPSGPGQPGAGGSRPQPQPQPTRPGGNQTQPSRPGGGNDNRPGQPGGGNRPGQPGGDHRPGQPGNGNRPGQPGGNYRPGQPGSNYRPGQPGSGNRPGQPGYPRPPVVSQPHRPGAGRPSTFRPMRAPPYRYPRGYSYRRWTVRMVLPAIFLSSAYLFQDYSMVGVGPPPPGYYWVRYGPDLLLVNRTTRRVVDVIYNAFYY